MGRFVECADRRQDFLLPVSLDDYVSEDNPVRAVEAFIDALDLKGLGFAGMMPAETGRPAYHPATMLKIYLYGYLNRVQSSRRLEREAGRNVELMWRPIRQGRLKLYQGRDALKYHQSEPTQNAAQVHIAQPTITSSDGLFEFPMTAAERILRKAGIPLSL